MTSHRSRPRRVPLLARLLSVLVLTSLLAGASVDAQEHVDSRPAPTVAPIRIVGADPRTTPLPGEYERRDLLERHEEAGEEEREEEASLRPPIDPNARPELVVPSSPQTPRPQASLGRAPGDFAFYATHQYVDAETADFVAGQACEPSIGMNGRISWVSGNWFANVSGDYLANANFVNPATNFGGTAVFCCDQVVQYDRTRGAMFWYLQYSTDANGNNIGRLAVSVGQPDQENNIWFAYDLSPQLFGYADSTWFDFPDLVLGSNYLYVTTDIRGAPDRAICMRMSLDDLAAGNTVTIDNFVSSTFNIRGTHGAGSTIWVASHVDNNTMRIWQWSEGGSPSSLTRDVDAWFQGSNAPDPNGVNWVGFDQGRIVTAYAAGSSVFFLWDSAEGGSFPFPHVRIAAFRQSDRQLIGQGQIWNSTFAWAYPAVHPNDRGDLGGVIAFGGGGAFPGVAAVVVDAFGGSHLGPYQGFTLSNGDLGPSTNRYGDYFTCRRANPFGNTWVATGWVRRTTEPGSQTEPWSCWFGREQDRPPAQKTIRVDLANTATWEDGTTSHPYDTVFEGSYATMPGDVVEIQAGTYGETAVLDRACTLRAINGTVVVGQ